MTDWLEKSDELHARVQAFIRSPLASGDSFDDLALAIANHQASRIPAYARRLEACASPPQRAVDLPMVPVEAFQLARVAVHPAEFDQVRFLTSGTTSGQRGQHCMRRTDTYRLAALEWGRHALLPSDANAVTVACLAPKPAVPQTSSLGFMMQAFLESFDPDGSNGAEQRWLLSDSGVDLPGLRRELATASCCNRPVLLLATSFALVYLLEALKGGSIPFEGRLIIMQTGGFKGRTREISAEELGRALSDTFAPCTPHFVGEYGMTELSSQLYEDTLPRADLISALPALRPLPRGRDNSHTSAGWYVPPPWLWVRAVDPVSYLEVADGEVGLAAFLDLANVDSAVHVLTSDRIVRHGDSIRLLGRMATAPARGCSLADEELIQPR